MGILPDMRTLLAVAALGWAASASAETLPGGAAALHGMRQSVRGFQQRFAPAPVDARVVDRLWRRVARLGEVGLTSERQPARYLERSAEPDARGEARNRFVTLVELPQARRSGFQHAVIRRVYSHMVASSEDWSRGPDGRRRVEIWRFTVALDGVLHAAERHEIVLKDAPDGARGEAEADESRSRQHKLRPSDPAVQRRWRALARELLQLGPVTQA